MPIRPAAVIAFVVAVGSQIAWAQAPREQLTTDDREVIEAVLSHTIRAHSRRFRPASAKTDDPIVMVDRTVPFCESHDPTKPNCFRSDDVGLLRDSGRVIPGRTPYPRDLFPDVEGRERLIEALINRNRSIFDVAGMPSDVRLVTVGSPDAPIRQSRELEARPYVGTSAPGYSTPSEAVVYAFNRCGVRCGEGWLFVLKKNQNGWTVHARLGVWIS